MSILKCLFGKHSFKSVELRTLELDYRALEGVDKPLLFVHTAKKCQHCGKLVEHDCERLKVTNPDWKEGLSSRQWEKLRAGGRLEGDWEEVVQ